MRVAGVDPVGSWLEGNRNGSRSKPDLGKTFGNWAMFIKTKSKDVFNVNITAQGR